MSPEPLNSRADASGPSDETLAIRSRDGDVKAFEMLARRFENRLYSYALRMTGDRHEAADQAQEVLLRIHQSLGRFDPKRKFAYWLFGIASHVCRDWLRRKRRRPEKPFADPPEKTAPERTDQLVEAAEDRDRVRDAVQTLPRKYREVIVLHYLEELPYDAVAAVLDITAPAARRRALRARAMLRGLLGGDNVEETGQ
ncbi:sigma-70 family RNA polymerase sigma factor [bacterium]|nr:sigma-70 family RNA polymerase sigma factor [bacterium]